MFRLMCVLCLLSVVVSDDSIKNSKGEETDLETAATGKLFDLGGIFNKNPGYGYGNSGGGYGGGYGNGYGSYGGGYGRPTYTGSYYPNYNSGGYYPSTSVTSYPSTYGNYPSAYGGYGGGYSGGYGGAYGGSYPQTGYPAVTRYYPSTAYGGAGGYGGYGGNGGLQSYYGYHDSGYIGNRNLGYGYYPETNRFGLYRSTYSSQPPYVSGYRGYN